MARKCDTCDTIIDGFNGTMVMMDMALWLAIARWNEFLYHECIESRLGRPLKISDFKLCQRGDWEPVPVNIMFIKQHQWTSDGQRIPQSEDSSAVAAEGS